MDDTQQPASRNVLRGRIKRGKFIGKIVQYEVEVGPTTVIVDDSSTQAKGVGANVQLVWDVEKTHIYQFYEDAEIGIGPPAEPRQALSSNETVSLKSPQRSAEQRPKRRPFTEAYKGTSMAALESAPSDPKLDMVPKA